MEKRIKSTMASVFNLDESQIDENASPSVIAEWDSLKHMNLILALEEEFGITFTDDEIVELLNYKLIYQTLKDKGLS
jgi:acyl carrier protein